AGGGEREDPRRAGAPVGRRARDPAPPRPGGPGAVDHRARGAPGRDLRDHEALLRIVSVVRTRPNFMKLFPVARALAARRGVEQVVVHPGQHYDPLLSDRLFQDLQLPAPDHHLNVGSGTQAGQTAAAMLALEPIFTTLAPDIVLVYGDVNSTLAATLVAAK